jgi:F-type H+-transporting ATPase subunit b
MDSRADKIRTSIDDAERAKNEAETVLADYQRQLAEARAESSRIIEEARAQAETVRRDIIARAEAEAVELRQRNAEQVAAERGRVMGELQGQVATLAIELAEKVVESNLDRDTNTRLIESYIATVGNGSR